MEEFYEQFQTKDYGVTYNNLNLLANGLLIMSLVSLVVLKSVGNTLISISGYLIVMLVIRNKILEYEYELTLSEIVITKIINKKKRKKLLEIDVKDIERITTTFDGKGNCRYINACLNESNLEKRYVYVRSNGKLIVIRMAMDEKLISICKSINPTCFSNI